MVTRASSSGRCGRGAPGIIQERDGPPVSGNSDQDGLVTFLCWNFHLEEIKESP